jgi:hypothetical protein
VRDLEVAQDGDRIAAMRRTSSGDTCAGMI